MAALMGDLPRRLFTPEQCHRLRRCPHCTWHVKTMGHHPECPKWDQ